MSAAYFETFNSERRAGKNENDLIRKRPSNRLPLGAAVGAAVVAAGVGALVVLVGAGVGAVVFSERPTRNLKTIPNKKGHQQRNKITLSGFRS